MDTHVNVSHCHEIGSVPFVKEDVWSGDSHRIRSEVFVRSRRSSKVCMFEIGCLSRRNKVRAKQKTYKSVGVMKD